MERLSVSAPEPVVADVRSGRVLAVAVEETTLLGWIWSLDTRLLELAIGYLLICRGIVPLLVGTQLDGSGYVRMLALAPEEAWGLFLTLTGVLHMLGVIINGSWRRSPTLRLICATAGLAAYTTLAATLYPYAAHPIGSELAFWHYVAVSLLEVFLVARIAYSIGRTSAGV